MGICYLDGTATEKNIDEGLRYLQKAATQGNARANFNLGVFYADARKYGCIERQNMATAVRYFREAAKAGEPKAQHLLGMLLINGARGIEKNIAEGRKLIEKAATQGFAPALFQIGEYCRLGLHGYVPDYGQAMIHYQSALKADEGLELATKGLQGLTLGNNGSPPLNLTLEEKKITRSMPINPPLSTRGHTSNPPSFIPSYPSGASLLSNKLPLPTSQPIVPRVEVKPKKSLLTKTLWDAIKHKNTNWVERMLEKHKRKGIKPDFHFKGNDGDDFLNYTPVHYAVICGATDIVRILCEAGLDVNKTRLGENSSPLASAASMGNEGMVKSLLTAAANPNFITDKGTPLAIAKQCKHHEVATILETWIHNSNRDKPTYPLGEQKKNTQELPQPRPNIGTLPPVRHTAAFSRIHPDLRLYHPPLNPGEQISLMILRNEMTTHSPNKISPERRT